MGDRERQFDAMSLEELGQVIDRGSVASTGGICKVLRENVLR